MNTRARAFVLGMPLSGLGVTRSLGEAGIRVTAVDLTRWLPALFSRYCDTLTCPSPVTDPDALLELLLVAGGRLERPAVLFPVTDAFVLFASRYRAELERRFLLALPPPSVSEALADKWLQHQLVEGAGIACPRTFLAESAADLDRIKREIDYPAFLKPRVSHLWAPVFTFKGVRVDSQADLERRLVQLAPSGLAVIVQSIVQGPNPNHFHFRTYVDGAGRALGRYVQRKIRQYPTDFGDATLVESADDRDVLELGAQCFERIHYRGLGSIEFKREARTGSLALIEVNPRLGESSFLATRCGVNFPLLAYLDLTGQKPAPRASYRVGVRFLVAAGKDVRAFREYYRRGELGPGEWIRSVARARVFPYLCWRDPVPFVAATARALWRRLVSPFKTRWHR